ncbi:hypothetical protein TNCV_680741 [Trichonephila clavipes]|nr:hypothetical protein TNCV_680741 [Trichonephila clavipes]
MAEHWRATGWYNISARSHQLSLLKCAFFFVMMMLGVTGKRNAKRSSIPYLDSVCGLMWVGLPGRKDSSLSSPEFISRLYYVLFPSSSSVLTPPLNRLIYPQILTRCSFANPTPLAHADTSSDVLQREEHHKMTNLSRSSLSESFFSHDSSV